MAGWRRYVCSQAPPSPTPQECTWTVRAGASWSSAWEPTASIHLVSPWEAFQWGLSEITGGFLGERVATVWATILEPLRPPTNQYNGVSGHWRDCICTGASGDKRREHSSLSRDVERWFREGMALEQGAERPVGVHWGRANRTGVCKSGIMAPAWGAPGSFVWLGACGGGEGPRKRSGVKVTAVGCDVVTCML